MVRSKLSTMFSNDLGRQDQDRTQVSLMGGTLWFKIQQSEQIRDWSLSNSISNRTHLQWISMPIFIKMHMMQTGDRVALFQLLSIRVDRTLVSRKELFKLKGTLIRRIRLYNQVEQATVQWPNYQFNQKSMIKRTGIGHLIKARKQNQFQSKTQNAHLAKVSHQC